ncbi:hypothetical protein BJ165DRAFT_919219 [Panaeolus papilionaceus]|nr:hypothetical protein BJ165DRAFT_919219 [Panaeolus papilionaceus]
MDFLPIEILGEIFAHTLPNDGRRFYSPNPHEAPLLLCHICRLWRNLTLKNGVLWANVSLSDQIRWNKPCYPSIFDVFSQQAKLWQDGSKSGIVSLEIDVRGFTGSLPASKEEDSKERESWGSLVRSILLSNTRRLRTLHINDPSRLLVKQAIWNNSFPALSVLHIEMEQPLLTDFSEPEEDAIIVTNVPSLRKVFLQLNNAVSSFEFPWVQLTHLVIDKPMAFIAFYNLLNQATLLEQLSVGLDLITLIESTLDLKVIPRLRQLSMTIYSTSNQTIFTPFEFPALSSLFIRSDPWTTTAFDTPFFRWDTPLKTYLLHNRFSLLRSLTLGYQIISTPVLLRILATTPLLEILKMDSANLNHQELFEAITFTPPDHTLIPKLHTLHIYMDNQLQTLDLLNNTLVGFLKSRNPLPDKQPRIEGDDSFVMDVAEHRVVPNRMKEVLLYFSRGDKFKEDETISPKKLAHAVEGHDELRGMKIEMILDTNLNGWLDDEIDFSDW